MNDAAMTNENTAYEPELRESIADAATEKPTPIASVLFLPIFTDTLRVLAEVAIEHAYKIIIMYVVYCELPFTLMKKGKRVLR
jgi:hypothetical protein